MKREVGDILQHIYDSEINIRIDWQWDAGVDWSITSGYDGCVCEARGTTDTVENAVRELANTACCIYPGSQFHNWYCGGE